MTPEQTAQLRTKARLLYERACQLIARIPAKARVVLGLFLVAAVFMAIYTAITSKDSSLHLKVQHNFRTAQVSVWVDGDLAYSGKMTGSPKKKLGFIPSDAVQGSLSQIIPERSGHHSLRVRIEPEDAAMQEDSISGDFSSNSERDLSVSARRSQIALSWQGSGSTSAETSSSFAWLSRYAGSLLLTIAGSIMSALTGYAIRELPGRLRSTSESAPKPGLGPQ